ncbi:hypothetical protein [uncultured Acinetobacter sp.]|uniref:lysozyme inhibitor LprI family protein n=1 Tax=uncultured Acinetobacter sp. TaxID=165433 RepID=UPI00260609DB|nr:hypothetical protein [uncultured Acinetobacter sp.]
MKTWAFLLFIACFSGATQAASFNCERAQTSTEKAVCEHRIVNDADVKMATSYTILRKLVPIQTRSLIQEEQIKWLQLRDQCQDNLNCLVDVYKMRQQKIDLHLNRIYKAQTF